MFELFKKQLGNKKDALARERACDAVKAIAAHSTVSPGVEPYLVAILPNILSAVADKMEWLSWRWATVAAIIVSAAGLLHILESVTAANRSRMSRAWSRATLSGCGRNSSPR